MRKTILLVIVFVAISVNSIFAYELTSQDTSIVNSISHEFETIMEWKWNQYRIKMINLLELYADKFDTKKPRYSSIFKWISNKLQENLVEDVDDNSTVWVHVDPVQCLWNAWELNRLEENNNDYDNYPRGHILVIENAEKEIITEYYKNQWVEILDIWSEEYAGDFMVCEACSCSQWYTLYLKIKKSDLSVMLEQDSRPWHSYKLYIEGDGLNCTDHTFSNCPSGCKKQCRSSDCTDGPNPACTDDCDGENSCVRLGLK